MLGTFFVVQAEVIKSKGDQFFSMQHNFIIPGFRGAKPIVDLNLQPMDDETMEALTARGRLFNKYGTGCSFLEYKVRAPTIAMNAFYNYFSLLLFLLLFVFC